MASQIGQFFSPGPELKTGHNYFDYLEQWGLGEYRHQPDERVELFGHVLWQEAKARGINFREFRVLGVPTHTFVAEFPNGQRLSFDNIPTLRHMQQCVWWTDNKAVMKKKFKALGIPVPRGKAVFSLQSAKKLFQALQKPVVVKPFEGSASRHTTLHVMTEEELIQAFKSAKQVAPFVMVEEEIPGSVYRPTLVDGKLVATIRRDPAHVVGDDTHTVQELVLEANKHPKRQGPYFSHIKVEDTALASSIPPKGQKVYLHHKINWSLGGTTTDVTDEVHPENQKLFEYIVQVLHAHIVGIDIIMEDISLPWQKQRCGVIECNGRPFFDNHHLPFEGKPRNVAGVLWNKVQPKS
ncbi:hypothetical protein KW798_03240 [Candidatus Parcubacteria bacterium]|nr:hypothetical protein [Candidatus Parcubacteria bacterium]